MRTAAFLKNTLTLAVGACVATTGALAQDDQNKSRKNKAQMLMEEVQVTARKRSAAEKVQDVPLAISAYGSEQLDAMFVQNLEDLSYAAPNVQLEAVGTFPGVQNFTIRGQGINSSIPSVDPTVGTFVDGVYLGTTYGVVLDMFEMEAVEMLRGPQGLLFGRNVTGGAVVLRTSRPTGEFGFRARTQVTDYDRYNFAAAIEGSLIEDKLAGKLVLYRDDDQGYFDNDNTTGRTPGAIYFNPSSPGEAGELKTTFGRGTLVLQASENLNLTLIAENGKTEGDGPLWTRVDLQRDTETQDNFTTTMDETGTTEMDWSQVTFEANLDVGPGNGRITNILGWREVEAFAISDVDGSSASIFTVPGETVQDQISNELRYAGSFLANKLDITTGLYYFQQDVEYRESRYLRGGLVRMALGGDMDHSTWGVFWNNDYHLNERFTLTAGVRYTEEDKDARVIDSSGGACSDVVGFNCQFLDLEDQWSNITPKLGLNYLLTDDAQLYAFWTKGFRSGGVNFRNAKPNLIPPGPTKEEEQQSYEIGLKSDLLGGRLRLNLAYFYNIVDDMQRELNRPDGDVVVLQATVNAGDVTIQGVEADFVTLIGGNFALTGSVGYVDGEYDRVEPALVADLGPDLPRLAPWTASIGATYDVDLGGYGSLTLRGNYSFRDRAAYLDSNREYFDQQHDASASINYTTLEGNWKISMFGKNLNNEARWGNLTLTDFGTVGPMQKGRRYGLEVEYLY